MPAFIRSYIRILNALLSDSLCRYKTRSLLIVVSSALGLACQILAFAAIFHYVNHVASGEPINIHVFNTDLTFESRTSLQLLFSISGITLIFLFLSALLIYYARSSAIRLSRLYNEYCIQDLLSKLASSHVPLYNKWQYESIDDKFFLRLLISDSKICGRVLRLLLTLILPILTLIVSFGVLLYLDILLTGSILVMMSFYLIVQAKISKKASQSSGIYEAQTPAANKKIIELFSRTKSSPLGFSVDSKLNQTLLNFAPFRKQFDAYEARRRYVEHSRVISGIFMATVLSVIILIMGERILVTKRGWGELIIYMVALRAAMLNLQPVFNQITSINRFYPQLKRYFSFTNAYVRNVTRSNVRTKFVSISSFPAANVQSGFELVSPSRTAVLFPHELNKQTAYLFLNIIFGEEKNAFLNVASDAALLNGSQPIPEELAEALSEVLFKKEINGIALPECLKSGIEANSTKKKALGKLKLANFSDSARYLISCLAALLADKKWVLMSDSDLGSLKPEEVDFLWQTLGSRNTLIIYENYSQSFAKWYEENVIFVSGTEIIAAGTADWFRENKSLIENSLNRAWTKNKKTHDLSGEDDLDEYE